MKRRLLVVLVTSLLALGGCGLIWEPPPETKFADLSTKEMLNTAERRVKDVDSVTVKGKGREDGQSFRLNMKFAPNSSAGTVVVDGAAVKLLSVGDKTYMKADEASYRRTGAVSGSPDDQKILDLVADQWMDTRVWGFDDLAGYASRFGFFADFTEPVGKVTQRPAQKVNGVLCIPLRDKEGTLYLDKRDGTPILLTRGGSSKERITFSYAPVAEFKHPSAARIITKAEFKAALRR